MGNMQTGAVYQLGDDFAGFMANAQAFGETPTLVEAEHRLERKLDGDERAAVEAVRMGQPVVPISGRVAQQLKVGHRELKRRARKRQTQARRRNR